MKTYHIDFSLLNCGSSSDELWGNLGFWKNAQSYSEAARALAQLLGEKAKLQKNDTILDVGFGGGDELFFWKQHFHTKRIEGVDITKKFVQLAQNRTKKQSLDMYIHVSQGSATNLDQFKESSFSKVISLDNAYHYQLRNQFVQEAYRILQPSGVLALSDIALVRQPRSWLGKLFLNLFQKLCGVPMENLCDLSTYQKYLEIVGFTNVQFECIERWVFPGFSKFIFQHWKKYFTRTITGGWFLLLCAGLLCYLLTHTHWIHYVLITTTKPSDIY